MGAKKKQASAPEVLEAPYTSPDEAFLAAIRAAPREDAPRLIYADHLLESGDEKRRLRGELIAVQCEAARLPRRSEEWRRALKREYELRNMLVHADELDAGDIQWDRGFATTLTTTPLRLERSWKGVHGHPIREIALAQPGRDVRPTLKELRFIARTFPELETLRFTSNREANGAFDPRGFGDLPDKGTKAWANGQVPHDLVRDHLTFLRFDDYSQEPRRLGLGPYRALPFPKLRALSLQSYDTEGMLAMSRRPLERLRWQAQDAACLAPVATLPHFAELRELDATVVFDVALARAIASSAITSLTMRHEASAEALAAFEPPPALRVLQLDLVSRGSTPAWLLPTRAFPQLETLGLRGFDLARRFDPQAFPKLTELALIYGSFDIALLAKLPRLETLTFVQCGIAHDAEAEIRERLPHVFITFQ